MPQVPQLPQLRDEVVEAALHLRRTEQATDAMIQGRDFQAAAMGLRELNRAKGRLAWGVEALEKAMREGEREA